MDENSRFTDWSAWSLRGPARDHCWALTRERKTMTKHERRIASELCAWFNFKKKGQCTHSFRLILRGSCRWLSEIDLLPNYGPGTSKRYRKPVTTGNTVISNCEKRNFRRSSDLAEAKIYLFAVLVIFDIPSTKHFFWSFCSQVGITMVLEGFSGAFVFGLPALLYRDFDNVSDGLDLSKSGWSFLAT